MPWESKTVEELRKEFIIASQHTKNFSSLCREFGITRATGYKWVKRGKNCESLSDKSHARKSISNKTDRETEQLILSVRKDNPAWGGKVVSTHQQALTKPTKIILILIVLRQEPELQQTIQLLNH